MLLIEVPLLSESWDEEKQEFVEGPVFCLKMEHSLVSMADWESKWCKPFISNDEKTSEEMLDYIKLMTLNENVPDEVYMCMTEANVQAIHKYIEAPMTATTFSNSANNGPRSREIITAEIIYYWMISLGIPVEFQNWHINRLLTLIKVCSIKNQPPKKMGKRETMSRNASLNAARRRQHNTKG